MCSEVHNEPLVRGRLNHPGSRRDAEWGCHERRLWRERGYHGGRERARSSSRDATVVISVRLARERLQKHKVERQRFTQSNHGDVLPKKWSGHSTENNKVKRSTFQQNTCFRKYDHVVMGGSWGCWSLFQCGPAGCFKCHCSLLRSESVTFRLSMTLRCIHTCEKDG